MLGRDLTNLSENLRRFIDPATGAMNLPPSMVGLLYVLLGEAVDRAQALERTAIASRRTSDSVVDLAEVRRHRPRLQLVSKGGAA